MEKQNLPSYIQDGKPKNQIDFAGNAGIKIVHDYLPYTSCRIKRILKEHYGAHLNPIGGYKCNRVPNYHQHYELVDTATGRVLVKDLTLDTLRCFFARRDFPLEDEYSANHPKRNLSAEEWLEAVNNLTKRKI